MKRERVTELTARPARSPNAGMMSFSLTTPFRIAASSMSSQTEIAFKKILLIGQRLYHLIIEVLAWRRFHSRVMSALPRGNVSRAFRAKKRERMTKTNSDLSNLTENSFLQEDET